MESVSANKIAYLSDSEIPSTRANTVHVLKMCSALAECGAEVSLFCNEIEPFEKEHIFKQYGIETRFSIVPIKTKTKGKLSIIDYARKKARIVRNGDFDICYGRSLLPLFMLRNTKQFIYESHIKPNRTIFKYLERIILKSRHLLFLVVISESLKQAYINMFPFLDEKKIIVLHDGADKANDIFDNQLVVSPELRVAHSNGVTIGYIGHLYPGKCMEVMMEVARIMSDRQFHVIGGTTDWIDHWKDECKNKGINNIIFYGYIANYMVSSYYKFLDVVILPFSDHIYYNKDKKDDIGKWISPLKLFEAMANKKAIIASLLPSIAEVIENEKDGILIPGDNPQLWKQKIEELCCDIEKRERLGEQAKFKLESQYTWKKRAERVLDKISKTRCDLCKQ